MSLQDRLERYAEIVGAKIEVIDEIDYDDKENDAGKLKVLKKYKTEVTKIGNEILKALKGEVKTKNPVVYLGDDGPEFQVDWKSSELSRGDVAELLSEHFDTDSRRAKGRGQKGGRKGRKDRPKGRKALSVVEKGGSLPADITVRNNQIRCHHGPY